MSSSLSQKTGTALRHDGVDYGDYIEQITYLRFLKMADERGRPLR